MVREFFVGVGGGVVVCGESGGKVERENEVGMR